MIKSLMRSALALIVFSSVAHAQVDVTASAGTANASYTTLKAAFDAINSGVHQGVIGIAITGNTTETATAALQASGGSSSYAQITLQPQGGAARSISGNIAGPLIDLNGADAVTIDGLNIGGNALTIANSSPTATASTVRFINDATSNVIQNCTINGSSAAATTGTIVFATTTGTSGNDQNTITGCDIGAAGSSLPFAAIWSQGTTTTAATFNSTMTISNNLIHDYFAAASSTYGIELLTGNSDWTISGNSFYESAARAHTAGSTTTYGIQIATASGTGSNFAITGNFIGGRSANAGGAAWTETGSFVVNFIGIATAVNSASIQNNTIANFAWTTTGNWRGIQTTNGTVNIGTVTGNTIGSGTGTGSITFTGLLAAGTGAFGIDASSTTAVPVAVSNNTIGSITTAGAVTIPTSITGIQAGANVGTISNNVVGSTATANSINASTASTAATGQSVTGISSTSASAVTITNNTVANLTDNYRGTGAAGQVRGIIASGGINTIAGNTVRNLATTSAVTGTGASAALVGISQTSVNAPETVSANLVHSIASTAASAAANVVGIHFAGPASGTNLVARNFVHSLTLSTSSTASAVVGINAASGLATYQNNMVRLGVNAAGASITTAYAIIGIAKSGTSGNNFYFNSVWVGGTGVGGATDTYAFRRTGTGADDMRDNIFVNVRQNGAGTGRHFAYGLNATTTATSDYNIYQAAAGSPNLATLDGGGTALGSLQALRAAFGNGQEGNSGAGDPRLVAPADPATSVSLKLQSTTPAEGSGVAIGSVTDDQEGDLRSSNTPSDIGADAGNYSMDASTDIFPPAISFTALGNTGSTGDRTLAATITDMAPAGGGVPTAGALVPRLWYKRQAAGAWASSPGSLTGGSGTNGTWSFTMTAADIAPAQGDSIQYYVVAQDQASTPNLGFRRFEAAAPVHSDVNTQMTPPATPLTYYIWIPFAGNYYVPTDPGGQASRTYPSLSGPGGLFAAINAASVAGNFAVIINGDESGETGANPLSAWLEDGVGGYTFTVNPDGTTLRTLSGTPATANLGMIKFNGASRVTIDGVAQYLRFRNTAAAGTAGAAIQFDNGASNDALLNCIIESSESNALRGALVLGGTASATVSNITISGNDLRNATAAPLGAPANLILGNSANIAAITISNNSLHNFTFSAINLGGWSNSSNVVGNNITISGNSLYDDAAIANASGFCAIGIGGAGDGHVVSGNFIGGKAPLCGGAAWPFATSLGSNNIFMISIRASGAVLGTSIQGNTIQNMTFSSNYNGFFGINTENGKFAIGTVTGNTIGHATTAALGITFARGAVQAPIVLPINAGGGASVDIRNNVIANLSGVNSGSGDPYIRGIALVPTFPFPAPSGNWYVENNTLANVSFPGTSTSGGTSAGIIMTQAGSPTPPVTYDIGGIAGNTVSGLTLGTTGSGGTNFGISINSGATTGQVVSNNTLTGITDNAAFTGIAVSAPFNAAPSTIRNNLVQGVTLNAPGGEFRGLSLTGNPSASGFGAASVTGNTVGSDTAPNSISNAGAATTTGIWVEGYNLSPSAQIDLSNSTVANLTASGTGAAAAVRGIYSGAPGGYVSMSGVNIHDLATAATNTGDGASAPAVAGLWLLGSQTPTIQNCNIHALRATTGGPAAVAVDGIYVNGGNGTLQRTRVWDLTSTAGSGTAAIRGVYQFGGAWTIANNQLSITNATNTNPLQILGIAQNIASGSGTGNVHYNSIYVGGSQSGGTSNSYAFVRQGSLADLLTDNLFFNDRSGGSGGHYAVGSLVTGTWSADHNALIAPNAAQLGQWIGADQAFGPWQSASGGDAASLGETSANVPSSQLLTDAANGGLDIKPTSNYDVPPIVSNAGAPVAGITSDFGGVTPRDLSNPDIGAQEITVNRTLSAPGNLAPASPSYAGNYDDVNVTGGGAPDLTGDVSVFGVLSLGGGNVTTGAHVVTIRPSGSVARTSGHVAGNLRKFVASGGGVGRTFEIGTGADYTPADVQFGAVSTPGYLQATTSATDHPDVGASGINPGKSANRYWTFNNSGTGFTTAEATFHFAPGDLDAGANPTAFEVRKYDAPTWTSPSTGARTATSTEATGITSFSDFVVGEVAVDTTTYLLTTDASPASGGAVNRDQPGPRYTHGTVVQLTAVPAAGYSFTGWSGDAGGSVNPITITMDAAKNVTANFALITYALDVTVVGSGTVDKDPDHSVYASGTVVSLTAHPATGRHFVGWSGDASGSTNPVNVTMDAVKHVTATFAINTYALDVTVTGSGSVNKDPDQSLYDHGTVVTLAAVPALGFSFVGWSGDASGSTNPTTVTMDAAKSVTATFAINMYALNLTIVGSGTVAKDPDQASFNHGTVVTLTATAASGYHFVGWSGDASGSANPTTVTMNAVKNVTATFAINTFVLTVNLNGSGTVTKNPDQPSYAEGTVVTLTAAPAAGNSFVGWSGALTGSTNPQAVTMNADKTVTAEFMLGGFSLDAASSGDGTGTLTVSPSYALYAPGSVVTLSASASYGSTFTGWSGDLTGTTSPQLLTMDANKTVRANIVLNSYVLTTIADAAAGGTIDRSPDLPLYGPSLVTITAQAASGWEFRSWCGDTAGTDSPFGVQMNTSKTVVGIFNPVGSPLVQVVAPNGYETINLGSDVDLQWTASGPEGVSTVDLYLSRSGPAGPFETIATGVPNSGSYTWTASGAVTNNAFLRVVAHSATSELSGWDITDHRFDLFNGTLAVGETRVTELNLLPISPNPARGQVRLEFQLPTEANVDLSIIDIAGRRVGTLASGTYGAGHHPMTWQGRGDQGHVAPGVYFARFTAGKRVITRRFVYLH